MDRLVREGNELARELTQLEYPGRRPIDPESGPGHYKEASRYAYEAAEALRSEDLARAQTLAAIGQIHATLAAAAATAVQDHGTELDLARCHQEHLTCLHAKAPAPASLARAGAAASGLRKAAVE